MDRPPRLLPGEHPAAPRPGNGQHLQRPVPGGDSVILKAIAHVDVGYLQGGKDLHRGSPIDGVGQVVVAHQKKGGDARRRQPGQTLGELPLLGLGWIAALIGIPGQQDQVHVLGQGVLHHLVQGGEKVQQAGGKAGPGIYPAVVLHADVQVREVQDAHD